MLFDYAALEGTSPLPYFMGMDLTLTRDIRKDEIVTVDSVQAPAESRLWALRAEQDRVMVI